jgi:hypothetical protein
MLLVFHINDWQDEQTIRDPRSAAVPYVRQPHFEGMFLVACFKECALRVDSHRLGWAVGRFLSFSQHGSRTPTNFHGCEVRGFALRFA